LVSFVVDLILMIWTVVLLAMMLCLFHPPEEKQSFATMLKFILNPKTPYNALDILKSAEGLSSANVNVEELGKLFSMFQILILGSVGSLSLKLL
jgi:hypothetical protein